MDVDSNRFASFRRTLVFSTLAAFAVGCGGGVDKEPLPDAEPTPVEGKADRWNEQVEQESESEKVAPDERPPVQQEPPAREDDVTQEPPTDPVEPEVECDSTCLPGAICGEAGCEPLPCSWESSFASRWGQEFDPGDVGFVTADGRTGRGIDSIDVSASESAVRVRLHGAASDVVEIRLFAAGTDEVLATLSGPWVYGLGHTAWRVASGLSGDLGLTVLRQFSMQTPTAPQLASFLALLLERAQGTLVPEEDHIAFRKYIRRIMEEVRAGELEFAMGHGHAIKFVDSRRTIDGATFSIQFSNSFGLAPSLGVRKEGEWGTSWTALPFSPTCGGLTTATLGPKELIHSSEPATFHEAEAACKGMGGNLLTARNYLYDERARTLAPDDRVWIGLTDLAVEGQFVWTSGEEVPYTNWAPGEPNDSVHQGGEDCVELRDLGLRPTWNDARCDQERAFVCEVPVAM